MNKLTRTTQVMTVLEHGGYILTGGIHAELFDHHDNPVSAWLTAVSSALIRCVQAGTTYVDVPGRGPQLRQRWELAHERAQAA